MHRLWCLVVIGALAVAVSMVGVDPAFAAKGGNNDTAKVCQHGGWKGLVSDAGGVFVNQGDCVNDGAQGSAPFGTAGKAACSDLQGPHGFDLDAGWNRSNLRGRPAGVLNTRPVSTGTALMPGSSSTAFCLRRSGSSCACAAGESRKTARTSGIGMMRRMDSSGSGDPDASVAEGAVAGTYRPMSRCGAK